MKTHCTVYTTSNNSIDELRNEISAFFKATPLSKSFISVDNKYELSIGRNDEFNEQAQKDFPDGFLYFKFIIDIDFKEDNNATFYVQEVGKILFWLWEKGMPAVASCDYEDLLPNKGGYKNKNVPWVAQ